MNKLCIADIEKNLKTDYIGRTIIYCESTGSTNDDAKRCGEQGGAEGSVFISETQTNGRGRMFRTWVTNPYESLAMSVLLRPCIKPEDAPTMTPVLAVSAVEAMKEITGIEVGIKWPNDIFADGRKLAGILTEMSVEAISDSSTIAGSHESGSQYYCSKVKYVVAGLGLNINQSSMQDELEGIATSLKILAGKEFQREQIAAAIMNRFEINYKDFITYGLGYFRDRLKEYSVVLGKEVVVISGLEMVEGIAHDIDASGNLVIQLPDGRLKNIIYGDVGLKYKDSIMGPR